MSAPQPSGQSDAATDWQGAYYRTSADLAYTEEQLSEERDITDALRDEVQRLRGALGKVPQDQLARIMGGCRR